MFKPSSDFQLHLEQNLDSFLLISKVPWDPAPIFNMTSSGTTLPLIC